MSKTRSTLVAALAVAALAGITAGSANAAASTTQLVSGTTLSTLALAATPVVLNQGFAPGQTATNTAPGTVTVTSTGGWTLTASDPNNGHLVSLGGVGCTSGAQTSEAQTVNQLRVTTAGTLGGTTGSTGVAITSGAPTIASGTLADTLSQTFSLALGSTESLLTGCAYSTTITYTAS